MTVWRRRTGSRAHPLIVLGATVLVAALGGLLTISLLGSPRYHIGPLTVRMSLKPSLAGRTVIFLPPLGSIEASTHAAPVTINAEVVEARVEKLRSLAIQLPSRRVALEQARRQLSAAMRSFLMRLLALAFVGGALAVLLTLDRRRPARAALGGALNAIILAVVLLRVYATYDLGQLRDHAEYRGGLRGAQLAVKLIGVGAINLGELDSGVQNTARSIVKLYEHLTHLNGASLPRNVTRILVISDIHNNTIGIRLGATLARLYDVDFVLNAGDLTELGTRFERDLATQVGRIARPHVFVTGNHDSPEITAALRRLRNTVLPGGRVVSVRGFRILGVNDPSSLRSIRRSPWPSRRQIAAARASIRGTMARQRSVPDILLVHSGSLALPFVGKFPIVVWGHSHVMTVQKFGTGVGVNPGSTGMSGLRFLSPKMPKAMSAVVLYVTQSPRRRVVAADLIEITSPRGEFTIRRKQF